MRPLLPLGPNKGKKPALSSKTIAKEIKASTKSSRRINQALKNASFDLWASKPRDTPTLENMLQLNKQNKLKFDGVNKKQPMKRPSPKTNQPESKRRGVELPHAGMSYNPDEVARQDARDCAARRLQKMVAEDRKWSRRIEVDPKVKALSTNELTDKGWSEDELESEIIEPRKQRKKTVVERNREKRNHKRASRLKLREREKQKVRDIDRIHSLKATLGEKMAIKEELSSLKKKAKALHDGFKVLNIGGVKFRPKPLAVLPQQTVQKNLRKQSMAAAGTNPLQERFDSYLVRNMLGAKKLREDGPPRMRKKRPYYVYDN
eukprot:GGOE01065269.1.p1 GENE.GGOE01065269.1~~GGOE01065269.1.p1  ORF type:complete len:333 (+),score=82.04 GGOE01065269.1:43-999(+)